MKLKATLAVTLLAGSALFSSSALAQDGTAVAPASAAERTDLPKATDIIEKSMKAYGGKERIRDIKTLRTVMSASMMGQEIVMDNAWQREGGRRGIMRMPMGSQEMGTDGKVFWMKSPMGYTVLEGEQADQVNNQTEMFMVILDPITQMKERNTKAATVGKESFNDRECYVILITEESGDTSRAFYDVETSRVVGMKAGNEPQLTTILFKEWKEVSGIQFFHEIEVTDPNMPMPVAFKVSEIQVNELGADYFALPAEVKAQADEKAAAPDTGSDGDIKLSDLDDSGRAMAEMQLKAILAQNPTVDQLKTTAAAMEQGLAYMPAGQKKTYEYIVQELKKEVAKRG